MEFLYNDCTADKWCLITEIYKMQIRKSQPPPLQKKNLTTKNPKKQKTKTPNTCIRHLRVL